MKAFEFNIGNYEIKREGNTLFIWELDHEGDRFRAAPLEITLSDFNMLVDESERLQAYHNPTCSEVMHARTDLENARGKSGHDFEVALSLYMSVANRHREASDCTVMH